MGLRKAAMAVTRWKSSHAPLQCLKTLQQKTWIPILVIQRPNKSEWSSSKRETYHIECHSPGFIITCTPSSIMVLVCTPVTSVSSLLWGTWFTGCPVSTAPSTPSALICATEPSGRPLRCFSSVGVKRTKVGEKLYMQGNSKLPWLTHFKRILGAACLLVLNKIVWHSESLRTCKATHFFLMSQLRYACDVGLFLILL